LEFLSERLRVILGGWVCDDLAELTAGSIYTKRERWPGIGTMTRGGRRRGSFTGAMNSWHLPWQSFRRSTESHNGSGDAVEVLRHVAQGRKAAVTGVLIGFHRDELCTVVGFVYWLDLSTARTLTQSQALSTCSEHESLRRRHESRAACRRRGLSC
jgi:hypothetical protein